MRYYVQIADSLVKNGKTITMPLLTPTEYKEYMSKCKALEAKEMKARGATKATTR